MEEVLLCERELYQNYAVLESLPVFLNLTFEEASIEYYSSTIHGSLCLTSVLNICEKCKDMCGRFHTCTFLSTSFACGYRKVLHHNYKT